jgi:hypothetical protein
MLYDHKQFLDLLLEYRSDETRKSRRNVSLIAFVILAAALLGLRLTDINAFGLSLHKSSPLPVLLLTSALLAYWTVMFCLAWLQDQEIQKERALLLEQHVALLIKRLAEMDEVNKQSGRNIYPDYGDAKGSVDAYRSQQERTKKASVLGRIIRSLEIVVPLALAAMSSIMLGFWIFNAL